MAAPESAAVDLLILDINDVVYRYDTDRRVALLAATTATTPAEVYSAVFDSGVEASSDAGRLDPDEYLAAIGEHLGVAVDHATWTASLAGAVTPIDESLAVVRHVRPHVDTVGLSNNGLLVKEQAPLIYPALGELDVELFVSAEFGGSKPEAKVYLGLCDELGVMPARAAFVDDRPANAHGAADAGLIGHHFTGTERFVEFLRSIGLPAG